MTLLKRFGILLLALLCALPLLSSCKKNEEEETVYYTVTFHSNGGSAVEPQTVAENEAVREPTPPTREGYVFEGWRTDSGTFWDFSSQYVSSDMTLTASWIDPTRIFEYEKSSEGGARITALKSHYPTLAVPEIIAGYSVTEIGEGVFAELSSKDVQAITLPHTVTSVGEYAFYNCRDISIVFDLRAELTSIGENAFYGCNRLASIRLGEGLSEIAFGTFSECASLAEIRLPKSVQSVADNAFSGCTSLTSIMFYSELAEIGDSAFKDCKALKALYFYGTAEQFATVLENTMHQNQDFLDASAYFYSDTQAENAWYLDKNGTPKLW